MMHRSPTMKRRICEHLWTAALYRWLAEHVPARKQQYLVEARGNVGLARLCRLV